MTLVAHGLGATDGEARIPASGLPGTRVVVTFPSHGEAADAPDGYWTYARVAEDVLAVADEVGARRAVGVSLGAGALLRIAATEPDRFAKLALLLPAALDQPRDAAPLRRLADASHDAARLRQLVAADIPTGMDVGDYVERRTVALLRLGDALRTIAQQRVLPDATPLRSVSAETLVVAGTDDPLHPAEVAQTLAAELPNARLEVVPSSAPMLTHRSEIRRLLRDVLA